MDANAIGNVLPKDDTPLARQRRSALKAATRQGRLRVLATAQLLQELLVIGASNWSAHRRIMRYLSEVAEFRLMLDTKDLATRELRLGRSLSPSERLVSEATSRQAWRAMSERSSVADIAREVREETDRFVEDEFRLRDEVLARLRAVTPKGESVARNVWRWWTEDPARRVRDFAEATARARTSGLGMVSVEALPALWHFHAYKVARIALTLARRPGGGISRGDAADAHHYTAAAYVRVFVSDDTKLRRTALAINAGPHPMTITEFAGNCLQ